MQTTRGGKFSFSIDADSLVRGLRPSKRVPRNSGYLIKSLGAVGRDGTLQVLDEITRLATTVIPDDFPYPQIFVFPNMIIVCSAVTIYEYEGGSLVAKHSTYAGDIWTAVAFHDYVYMSNNKVVVIRSAADKTYSETSDLPINLAACNYNGQVVIYAPEVNPEPIPEDNPELIPDFEVFFEFLKSEIGQSIYQDADSHTDTVAPSIVNLNSDDFDGVVKWEFEAIWCNRSAEDVTLQVIDTSGTVYATMTLSPGLSSMADGILFRSRMEFTPGDGDISYCLKYSRGPVEFEASWESRIIVPTARIIITQTRATKTKIQIPLMGSNFSYVFDTGGYIYNGYSWGAGHTVQDHADYSERWASSEGWPGDYAMNLSTIWKYKSGELRNVSKAKFIVDAQDTPSSTTYSKIEHIGATSDINYFDMQLYWAPADASDNACNRGVPGFWISETQVHTDDCTGAVFTPIPGTYVHWHADDGPFPYSFETTPDFSGVPHDAKIFIGGDITLYGAIPGPWGHFSKWFNNPATAEKYVHDEKLIVESVDSNHMDWTFKYTLQTDYSHEENLFVALKNLTTGEIVPNSELIWYADEFAYRQETEITLTDGCEYKIVAKATGIRTYQYTNIFDAMLLININPIGNLTTWYRCVHGYIKDYDNVKSPDAWNDSDLGTRIKLYNPNNNPAYFEVTGTVSYWEGHNLMMLERITNANDVLGSGIAGEDVCTITFNAEDSTYPGTAIRKRSEELSLINGAVYGNRQPDGEDWYVHISNGFIVLRII